jgi:HPt (histidine-containing phosphotransfer) domain-containing protein
MAETGDRDGVERGAHTLRGLSATLGAMRLLDRVTELQAALKSGNSADEAFWLASTSAEMQQLLAALDAHLGNVKSEPDRGAPRATATGEDQVDRSAQTEEAQWLNALCAMLSHGDNDARDLWLSRQPGQPSAHDRHTVQDISAAIDNFDFDRALRLLGPISPNKGLPTPVVFHQHATCVKP